MVSLSDLACVFTKENASVNAALITAVKSFLVLASGEGLRLKSLFDDFFDRLFWIKKISFLQAVNVIYR